MGELYNQNEFFDLRVVSDCSERSLENASTVNESFKALEGETPFREATPKRTSPSCLGRVFYFTSKPVPVCLRQVRNSYKFKRIDFNQALDDVLLWRESKCFLSFKNCDDSGKLTYSFSKASKRGNDVYRWRVKQRFSDLLSFCDEHKDISFVEGNKKEGFFTRVFKATLTVDRKLYTVDEFNSKVCSLELDKFVKRIRNKFDKDVKVSRTYEVHKDGYLHVNLVFFFPNRIFPIFYLPAYRDRKGKCRRGIWRLKEKNSLSKLWSIGFSDFRAVENTHDLIEYCLKYQIKYFRRKANRDLQNRTLSVLSLYNKRSYSIPKSFENGIYGYLNDILHCSDKKGHEQGICSLAQNNGKENINSLGAKRRRLDNKKHNSPKASNDLPKCKFLGVFHESELEFEYNFDLSQGWYFYSDVPPFDMSILEAFENDHKFHIYDELCKFDSGTRIGKYGSFTELSRTWKPHRLRNKRFRTGFFYNKPKLRRCKRVKKLRHNDKN